MPDYGNTTDETGPNNLGAELGRSDSDWVHPGRWGTDLANFFGVGSGDPGNANRGALTGQSSQAGAFANQGQAGYTADSAAMDQSQNYLQGLASGQNSVTALQLRQGLQQNLAAQQAQAASASPNNSAMASRNAAMNSARMGYGYSGQQALAGLQERNQAQQNLAAMLQARRAQDLQAALGSRQNAMTGYNDTLTNGQKTVGTMWGGAIGGAAVGLAASDERLKKDVDDGDKDSRSILDGLKSYSFNYKDEKHGKGRQYGVMAQELERSGLGHTVIDTPTGKMVHGAKAATSALALVAALGRRVAKIEAGK